MNYTEQKWEIHEIDNAGNLKTDESGQLLGNAPLFASNFHAINSSTFDDDAGEIILTPFNQGDSALTIIRGFQGELQIVKGKVYIDLNNNELHDASEAAATLSSNGTYRIELSEDFPDGDYSLIFRRDDGFQVKGRVHVERKQLFTSVSFTAPSL